MAAIADTRTALKEQIAAAEQHLLQLKQQLAELERYAVSSDTAPQLSATDPTQNATSRDAQKDYDITREPPSHKWPLLQDEYRRYGRQMIVDQVGLQGTSHRPSLLFARLPRRGGLTMLLM